MKEGGKGKGTRGKEFRRQSIEVDKWRKETKQFLIFNS
jgi:hypothetical protein